MCPVHQKSKAHNPKGELAEDLSSNRPNIFKGCSNAVCGNKCRHIEWRGSRICPPHNLAAQAREKALVRKPDHGGAQAQTSCNVCRIVETKENPAGLHAGEQRE